MKTFLITILIAVSIRIASGQAVLEKTFPGEYINSAPILLTDYGWVYPTIMYNSNVTLKLYADDYTILKSIYLAIPSGYQYLGIYNISDKLFNNDYKVEILFSVYNYQVQAYDMLLVNESGLVLQEFPKISYAIIYQVNGLFKMYMNNATDSIASIYSLPGTMLGYEDLPGQAMSPKVFPDPCSTTAMIRYSLPEGTTNALLDVFSTTGKRILEKPVSASGSVQLDVTSFPPGEYLYTIKTGNGLVSGGKFIRK
jgi:hypothetical protein